MLRRSRSVLLFGILLSVFFPVCLHAANKLDRLPNIILVTLDSTRADRMGFLGARRPTPNLDALARESVVFERAYAQAPLTVVSHASILSGTYPQTNHASELGAPIAATVPYLPELLRARGYRTAAFVGSILLDPHNGFAPGLDRGFDTYDAGYQPPSSDEQRYSSAERPADQVIARAIHWMSSNAQKPFFLWVHLENPHARYEEGSYEHAVAAVDFAVGRLVVALRAQKLYEGSAIVLTSDHGQSLGAHGEDTHGIFLYDETIRVPLLIKLPRNQMAGRRIRGRARLLDVAPSVLEIAGAPVPSQMQGQSLLRIAKSNPDMDEAVYAQNGYPRQAFGSSGLESWRAGKYLYIRAPNPELYDLSTDPNATHNLAQKSKATLETMAGQLQEFDRRVGGPAGRAEEARLSSSEMQRLSSLGYVGLQTSASAVNTAVEGTDPKDIIAAVNKTLHAMTSLNDGKAGAAILEFQQVLAKHPTSFLPQWGLGIALARQQRYPEAIEHLHKAIELQPNFPWAHYEMGLSLMKTSNFKVAAIHLEIASHLMPSCAELHTTLAQTYERLGRPNDANRERAKASQLSSH